MVIRAGDSERGRLNFFNLKNLFPIENYYKHSIINLGGYKVKITIVSTGARRIRYKVLVNGKQVGRTFTSEAAAMAFAANLQRSA